MVFFQLAWRFLRSALILNRAARQIEHYDALTKQQRYLDNPERLPSSRIIAKLSALEPALANTIEDLETALLAARTLQEDVSHFRADIEHLTSS